MTGMFDTLKSATRNRIAYSRTVAEIEKMPLDVALDLGIDRADARRIAHRAVWG